jgi:DNA-binding CsgD family transcriptional regulator
MDDRYATLLEQLYAAASEGRGWDIFLKTLSEHANSATAALMFHGNRGSLVSVDWGINPEAARLYERHFWEIDEWYLRAKQHSHAGWVAPGQSLIPLSELQRSEFYNDLLSRYDMQHQCGAVIEQDSTRISVLSLLRGMSGEPFEATEISLLRALLPHLQRAIQLYRRVGELEAQNVAASSMLDGLNFGLVLLRPNGSVSFSNRLAVELGRKFGLQVGKRGMALQSASQNRRLQSLVESARSPRMGTTPGGAMKLAAPNGAFVVLLVSPLKNSSTDILVGNSVAVFISDPNRDPVLPEEILRTTYDLTPSEVKLCVVLAAGLGAPESADRLGITVSTARSQLKSIFQKTGTQRQSQLTKLLMNLSQWIEGAEGRK